MASSWTETSKVARQLSTIPDNWASIIKDYAGSVETLYDNLSVDRRTIAVGADFELHLFNAFANMDEDLEAGVYTSMTMHTAFMDTNTDGTPQKVLSDTGVPLIPLFEQLQDAKKQYTFMNNEYLHHFEQYALTHPDIKAKYDNLRYSAMDEQDLLAGEGAGTYNVVRIKETSFIHPDKDMKLLDAYLGLLKVHGFLLWSQASNWGSIYSKGVSEMHTDHYTRFNEHIRDKENFTVYHIPMEHGLVIAKRTA